MLRSGRVQAVLAAAAVAAVVGAGTAVPAGAAAAGPSVFGFGSNQSGELGNGTTAASYLPVPASGPPGTVRQIAAGYFTSAALISDGTVWVWGSNNSGALGTGSSGGWVATPQQVPGLSSVTQIALGIVDVYAVRSDGTLWAWGFNQSGQLGNGTTAASYQPVRVPGLTGITQVSAGTGYVLARRSDGTVWAWGDNSRGFLGDGTTAGRLTPERVPGLTGITQVSAGTGYVLARRSDGTVWAWGDNSRGFLGDGTTAGRLTPERVPGLTGITEVAANWASFAVRSDGTLFGWGADDDGALGNGTSGGSVLTPAPVPGLTGVTQVASNNGATLALAGSGGTVWAWGWNDIGQLGDGTTVSRLSPERLTLTGVTQIAVGISGGSAAIRSDGTLLTWGGNGFGNLGHGTQGGYTVTPAPVRSLTGVSQVAFGGGYGGGYGLALGSRAYATVPSLANETTTAAGQRLQAANLVLGTVNRVIDNLCNNIGTVISQSPAAGTVLIGGSAVSVTVGVRPSHPCP
jgi:alpha-tubulin suppressor-like RCC1 family protein